MGGWMSTTLPGRCCDVDDGGRVETDASTGVTRVVLHGEIDACTGAHLHVLAETAASTRRPVTVDMEAVSFLDCTGIAFLVALTKRTAPRRVTVRHAPPQVASLLAITQLTTVLDVVID